MPRPKTRTHIIGFQMQDTRYLQYFCTSQGQIGVSGWGSQNGILGHIWNGRKSGVISCRAVANSPWPPALKAPLLSLPALYFSQKDKILVVFGYLANDHGRNCSILVIFSHFGLAIVFLSLHIDNHSTPRPLPGSLSVGNCWQLFPGAMDPTSTLYALHDEDVYFIMIIKKRNETHPNYLKK